MERIILLHTNGKQGVNLPLNTYNLIRDAIVESFLQQPTATQVEITDLVSKKISSTFEGDIAWHIEVILPDLIAREYLEKILGSEPPKFRLKFFRC